MLTIEAFDEFVAGVRARVVTALAEKREVHIQASIGTVQTTKPGDAWEYHEPSGGFLCTVRIKPAADVREHKTADDHAEDGRRLDRVRATLSQRGSSSAR